ncbi:chorismate-binding protein [Marinicella rhabdoformis]|uniref:chorismate-binding protein n=1 Tax=Marinicella rhabdoformis TaxID=2580566 RepID=UPI0012AEB256|nr:chorismate-binding protein [Marinicella rhabdoformis]
MVVKAINKKPDFQSLATDSGFFPVLLESQSNNPQTGRYSILMAAPASEQFAYDLSGLNKLLNCIDQTPKAQSSVLPFEFGWMVYLAYECAAVFEEKLAGQLPKLTDEPLAVAIYCQGAVLYDHIDKKTYITAEDEVTAAAIASKVDNLDGKAASLKGCFSCQEEAPTPFKEQVKRAKEYIVSGDIYQANLSRQWNLSAEESICPLAVFAAMKAKNPAPFAALLQTPLWSMVSSSPERLVQVKSGQVSTRPIAGTRPRSEDADKDRALIEELLNTPKEQAEHVMLIDLERNDIGRVSKKGTVHVDELMVIESYPTVHHIVSNVVGQLIPGATVVDVLRSLFPGGTITGCPKVRCMEVIAELEQRPRGFYTGSIGYINHDGQMDFNILIRSLAISDGNVRLFAGAGIVHDSDPDAELIETRHKARGLLRVLGAEK